MWVPAGRIEDVTELDALVTPLVAALNPTLLARNGVGADTSDSHGADETPWVVETGGVAR